MAVVLAKLKAFFRFIYKNLSYILWFIFYFFISYDLLLTFSVTRSKKSAFFFCLFAYIISITLALVFGEKILKFINGVRPIETREEKEYLLPLFEDVYSSAKEIYPNLPVIKLHIIDSISINALAIGKHTVAVTKGAIEVFNEDELKAIILHEFSHIYNGNTKAEILNKIGNGIFTAFVIVFNFFSLLWEFLLKHADEDSTEKVGGFLGALVALIRLSVNISVFVILFIGNVILSGNSRKNELTADEFAFSVGYGEELTSALYILQKMSLSSKTSLTDKIRQHHPRISKRIENLENLQESKELNQGA